MPGLRLHKEKAGPKWTGSLFPVGGLCEAAWERSTFALGGLAEDVERTRKT